MVAEMPQTKPAGARPPNDGLPPILVTFSPEPDDRDRDMLVYLRDNVRSLLSKIVDISQDQVRMYSELLATWWKWVKDEIEMEERLSSAPAAPLGIETDPYDLSTIGEFPRDFRREKFEELLSLLDQARSRLEDRFWEQLWASNPS